MPTATVDDNKYVLEQRKRYSDSMIWNLQRQYYENDVDGSWDVPYYITSSAAMGRAYAEVILAFLRDLAATGKVDETVHILELGAGHGRLSFYLLKHLTRFYRQSASVLPKFRYILSDFSRRNLDSCMRHPKLRPFAEEGILDFCIFDMLNTDVARLEHSGFSLTEGALSAPMVVIANYVFDTIPQDLYYMRNSEFYDCLLTVGVDADPDTADGPPAVDDLFLKYTYEKAMRPANEADSFDQLINRLAGEIAADSHFLFPECGLRCIERLRHVSQEGLLLLTADKGGHLLNDVSFPCVPDLVTHGNGRCFSLPVNYAAFRRHCEDAGGLPLFPERPHYSIDIGCLLYLDAPESFRETEGAYRRQIGDCGPDLLFKLSELDDENEGRTRNFADFLAALSAGCYDPHLFMNFLPSLIAMLPALTVTERDGVPGIAARILEMNYPMSKEDNLPYALGALLIRLGFFREALGYLRIAEERDKRKEILHDIMFCLFELEDYEQAAELMHGLSKSVT